MPSTSKTSQLSLNQWTGSDKPKRADFNSDNEKLDEAIRAILQSAAAHSGNGAVHVTQAEKDTWSGLRGLNFYPYTGNGLNGRVLSFGKKPTFGVVFAINGGICDVDLTSGIFQVQAGFFSTAGCSDGVSLQTNGIAVNNQIAALPRGYTIRMNHIGVNYLCVYWE